MRTILLDPQGLDPPVTARGRSVAEPLELDDTELDMLPGVEGLLARLGAVAQDGQDVLIVDGRLRAHGAALRSMATDPRLRSAVLVRVLPEPTPSHRAVVMGEDAALRTAASPLHEPVAAPVRVEGVVRLAAEDLAAVTGGLRGLEQDAGREALTTALRAAPVEVIVAAALGNGVRIRGTPARHLVAVRPEDDEERAQADVWLETIDEEDAWLANAVKARDGWFTTFLVSPYSRYVARWFARRGTSPNLVTILSLLAGIAAAISFGIGTRPGMIVGAGILQVAFMLDCADGQLARYAQRFSAFGGWLDSMADRAKEYVVYLGLAIGSLRLGAGEVWTLALAAMALQVVRHSLDMAFADSQRPPRPAPAPLVRPSAIGGPAEPSHAASPQAGRASPARSSSTLGVEQVGVVGWVRRILGLPIGERFAVISVLAAASTPRVAFLVLLIWGIPSVGARTVLQILRTVREERGYRWLVASVPRLVEIGTVVALASTVGQAAILFAYLCALATRLYDVGHRRRALGEGSTATPLAGLLGAWYARTAILLAAAFGSVLGPVAGVLAGLMGALTLVDLLMVWTRASRHRGRERSAS